MTQKVPKLYSAELQGISAHLVEVEADINVGLHAFTIVGLGDKAVSEAKERINSALKHCGIKPPTRENRKITINLAPANIKKTGSHFDLPIALAYLLASTQMSAFDTRRVLFLGELALDGSLRPVNGVLNYALKASQAGFSEIFVPLENAREASYVSDLRVHGVSHLSSLIKHLEGSELIESTVYKEPEFVHASSSVLFTDIIGLHQAKRAVLVAAAGGHNLLLRGVPGAGKTMLAQAYASLLPPLTLQEALEVSRVYSALGFTSSLPFVVTRPFRSPHHSASLPALVGGGNNARPGEVSLAHRGVLFLDEAPEFRRDALESLRQPLESGEVVVSRAKLSVIYPARFSLVLAMNPCPCGYYGDETKECRCSAHEVLSYSKRLSGPLLDRIDIHVAVPRTPAAQLLHRDIGESFDSLATLQRNVVFARERQLARFSRSSPLFFSNAEIPPGLISKFIKLSNELTDYVVSLATLKSLSPRACHRILRVARTIADLEGSDEVLKEHIAEAFHYRMAD